MSFRRFVSGIAPIALASLPAASQFLSPSSSYNGATGSGFGGEFPVAPTDPTRTTAKPTATLLDPPRQTITDTLQVSVEAFALNGANVTGGVEKVRFHLEGSTIDATVDELRTFTRIDASTYKAPCFSAILKRPDGVTGLANLYIEIVPTNAALQSRVLGPYTFRFAAAQHDLELEVAPSQPVVVGESYQALGPALAYCRTQAAKNPKITITEAGSYNFANAGFGYYIPDGYVTITATAAVSLGHLTQQASDTAALVRPNIDRMWFEGPNVTLDFRYMLQLYVEQTATGWHVFNGCRFTNSAGRDTYWRKSTRPIVPTRGRNYYLDCEVTEMDNATANAMLARGVVFDTTYGDIGQGAQAMVGCKTVDHSAEFFATDLAAMTVVGPAGATLSAVGSHNGPTRDFTAKVSGSTVGTYQAKSSDAAFQADDNYHVAQVVDWINTLSGWTAVLLDDTRRAVVLAPVGTAGQEFTDLDVSSVTTLYTIFDVHADFYQQPINDAVGSENVLIYGNSGINWTGQVMLPSGRNPQARDMFFINNAFYNNPDNSTPYAVNSAFFSQFGNNPSAEAPQSHVVFVHNTLCNQGVLLRDDLGLDQDEFCLLANNSVRSMRWDGAQVGDAVIANNLVHDVANSEPQGATGTVKSGDETTLYVSAATGNFTPAAGLASNLKAPVFSIDINGNARAANDAVGAVRVAA